LDLSAKFDRRFSFSEKWLFKGTDKKKDSVEITWSRFSVN